MTSYTVDDLNRHLITDVRSVGLSGLEYAHKELAPRIDCADGYSVSVQASSTAYSTPRDNSGPYTHVECGFARYPEGQSPLRPAVEVTAVDPSDFLANFKAKQIAHRHEYAFVEEWREWAEDADRGDTVYGFVPVEAVVAWINAHGGVSP